MLAVSIAASGDVKISKLDVDVLGVSIAGSGDFAAAAGRPNRASASADRATSMRRSGRQTVKVRIAPADVARMRTDADVSVAGSRRRDLCAARVVRKSIRAGDVRRAK